MDSALLLQQNVQLALLVELNSRTTLVKTLSNLTVLQSLSRILQPVLQTPIYFCGKSIHSH
jgi:hypothetical protein